MLRDSHKNIITRNKDSFTRLEYIKRQLAKDDINLSLSAIDKVINGNYTIMPITITSRILKLSSQEPVI